MKSALERMKELPAFPVFPLVPLVVAGGMIALSIATFLSVRRMSRWMQPATV